jgi:hypothetical protein
LLARLLYRNISRNIRYSLHRNTNNIKFKDSLSRFPLPSSPLLAAIVALARSERDVKGVQAIVNYNFDDIVDESLRRENVRCQTVLSGRDKVPAGTLACYHVHGVLPISDYVASLRQTSFKKGKIKVKGNFVFSEDQYHAEYADPYKWSNMTQMSLLGRFTGLFIGLSMEDPNIRRLIDVTHSQYPEISNYAILPRRFSIASGPPSKQKVMHNLFEDVESTSFSRIGVKVIWVNDYKDIPPLILKICDLGAT